MSIFYLLIKLYPLFGLSLTVLCFDLTRTYRRRANPVWIGFALFCAIFAVTTVLWFVYRGDINSEKWFTAFADQFR
ncbi:MAG: hypothetical protein JST80_04105 [Bdellovibrionales bacterium]|nr:hypothetical protein [Bdellovibrionales bacterium]